MATEEAAQKRIVVLGSDSHPGATASYKWHDKPSSLNIADFECAILDLTPFEDKKYAQAHKGKLPKADSVAWLLFSPGGELVIMGAPSLPHGTNLLRHLLPISPHFSMSSGQEIIVKNQEFAFYLKEVNRWEFHFELPQHTNSDIVNVYKNTIFHDVSVNDHELMRDPICVTRFSRAIAIELKLRYTISSSTFTKNNVISGPVIWLPPPTKISPHEAIELILRERYGIGAEKTEPEWIEPFRLPNQIPIEERISAIATDIKQLQMEQEEEQRRLAEERKYLKLLYETGTPLEVIVRDSFRDLGAQVDVPEDPLREDARMTDAEGRNYMVEIKGQSKSASVKNVRQANDWVQRATVEEAWEGKGILIINTYCNNAPDNRDLDFPDNVAGAASRVGLALMTTIDLYKAVVALQEGTFDQTHFWRIINEREGICDFPEWVNQNSTPATTT